MIGKRSSAGLETFVGTSDLPIASLLVFYTGSFFDLISQFAASPNVEEIGGQLDRLRSALEMLGSLAQGNDGSTKMNPCPIWFIREDEDPDRGQLEAFIRQQNNRTPALHPLLQDHISMAYATAVSAADGAARDAELEELRARQMQLVEFFDRVPNLIRAVNLAAEMCAGMPSLTGRPRSSGAPTDSARNWALVRLMWIWRDVFEQEIKIYLRRIRNGTALQVPEPQGCMAFVVDALRSFSPVGAHELPSLEARLGRLRDQVPSTPLLRPRS